MRLLFGFLCVALVTACGGSTSSSSVPDDERVPASPVPSDVATGARGPTGFVSLLSIDGYQIALPSFYADAERFRDATAGACVIDRSPAGRREEVSAGTVTFEIPTRNGTDVFDVRWDDREKSYEPHSYEGLLEPGGLLRISAAGDTAPAFSTDLRTAANVAFHVPETVDLDATSPRDLVVRWDAEGDNDEVFLNLGIGDTDVTCWFDSKAGSGTIPAALVAEATRDAAADACGPSTCLLFLASKRTKNVEVRDWTMVVTHGFAAVRNVHVTR